MQTPKVIIDGCDDNSTICLPDALLQGPGWLSVLAQTGSVPSCNRRPWPRCVRHLRWCKPSLTSA